MDEDGLDPAYAKERRRLIEWEAELGRRERMLRTAVSQRDTALMLELKEWFNRNGVDSLAGY